jgi:hypothetical protein
VGVFDCYEQVRGVVKIGKAREEEARRGRMLTSSSTAPDAMH